ncbi:hypothetical protein HMPREF6123_1660 [Oribacterium sinus F0268]|uniref:Uncharacterized protein n=1 Tax=Oribacterium sinus F0268 TaxID=585501 RepID=C2KYU1_9FIRM|nr:hypothetical protein HMPREF6123_1660 [Oribacterium sinus F0268]
MQFLCYFFAVSLLFLCCFFDDFFPVFLLIRIYFSLLFTSYIKI